ncbi:MAG: hypothetical protein HY428_01830 [Candidatus Levybacteria bacterium]|nr:hypothetical protein [Candidatus Levybacteria bacterium]
MIKQIGQLIDARIKTLEINIKAEIKASEEKLMGAIKASEDRMIKKLQGVEDKLVASHLPGGIARHSSPGRFKRIATSSLLVKSFGV